MWELDHKDGWAPKNWCFWTVVLEKTLESSLDCKEIKPINPKGNQPWIFTGRTDAEAEAPIFDHLMWRTDSLEKILMLGKIEGRRRRKQQRMRWLDGITYLMDMSLSKLRYFVDEVQGSPVSYRSCGHKGFTLLSEWTTKINIWNLKKWMHVTKQKQIHKYRKHISAYLRGEWWGEGQDLEVGVWELPTAMYKINKDL